MVRTASSGAAVGMPEWQGPLQWSNFTGWSPTTPNPAIAQQKSANFAMQNRPFSVTPPLGANRQNYNTDWSPINNNNGGSLFNALGNGLGINSGIQSGTLPQADVNRAQGMLGFSQAPGVPAGGASGFLNQQFNDVQNQMRQGASTDLARRAAHEGGVMNTVAQRARADDTLGMGELWRRLLGTQLGNADFGQGLLFNLLGGGA